MLPIQRRVGPAPAPVMGTDESGRTQAFTQPGLGLGVPQAIAAPAKSLINSADATARGEVPSTEDILRVIATGALTGLGAKASEEALLSAGARTRGIVNRPNITPGSIASEHALDMATLNKQGLEAGVARTPTPSPSELKAIQDKYKGTP